VRQGKVVWVVVCGCSEVKQRATRGPKELLAFILISPRQRDGGTGGRLLVVGK